jgi:hypothetical protein
LKQALFSNELFQWLHLDPTVYWKILLFSDVTNYGGITEGVDESTPSIQSNWNLAEYLPPPIDQSFIITVSEYLMNLYQQQRLAPPEDDAPVTEGLLLRSTVCVCFEVLFCCYRRAQEQEEEDRRFDYFRSDSAPLSRRHCAPQKPGKHSKNCSFKENAQHFSRVTKQN